MRTTRTLEPDVADFGFELEVGETRRKHEL
jgi:hypothetical protein